MVFIVGMGRSGTTMLTNMLNLNNQVIACPENEFVLFTQPTFKNKNFENESIVDEFVNLFNYKFSKVISFWKPKPELKPEIMKLENKSFSNVCKQVYLNYPFGLIDTKNITCIVDKNPIYSLYIDDLNRLFPDSKYIVLSRDYRDNILSRKKFSDKKSSIYSLAVSWNYFYDAIFKSVKKNQLDYTILRYEDIVDKPAETLNKLCDFLNIEFDEQMLHFQNLSRDIKNYVKENLTSGEFDKLNAMHHNLEKKINVDRVDSYKKELSKREIFILDNICFEQAKVFDYLPNGLIKRTFIIKFRMMISFVKTYLYYKIHSIRYKIPMNIKLYFASKK